MSGFSEDQLHAYVDGLLADVNEPTSLIRRASVSEARAMMADGTISRAVVTGRILYGETVRAALLRHLAKDLGPLAQPQLPPNPSPFTVIEYFPDATVTGFVDPRQHAVSLAYIVPVLGECFPAPETLAFTWVTPEEAASPEVSREMTGGQDRLVRMALAATGCLP